MQPTEKVVPEGQEFIDILKADELIMIFKKKDGFAVRVDFLPDDMPLKTFLHRIHKHMKKVFKRKFKGFYFKNHDERSMLHLWYAKDNFKKAPNGFTVAKSVDGLENYPTKPFRRVDKDVKDATETKTT